MAQNSFTESTSTSWGGRIVSSLTGVVVGIIFIPVSIILLSWNEHNSVTTMRSLKEGASVVVNIQPDSVNAANESKLVHVTGGAVTSDAVTDPTFALSAKALRLNRKVEIYEWKETESSKEVKDLGGGTHTEKTYTYKPEWSEDLINSSDFKHPEDHTNPTEMLGKDRTFIASKITLGAFTVPDSITKMMEGDEAVAPTSDDYQKLSDELKNKGKLTTDGFYFGKDSSTPTVGDQRVTFMVLKPGTFSIIAQQSGSTFEPYQTKSGDELERVESGTVGAPAMFAHAQSENAMMTWIWRLVGFVVMFVGFAMIFKPLSVLGDVIPFIGNIIEAGTGLAAFLLALAGTFLTIAIAWLVVRPLFGGALLIIAVVAIVGIVRHAAGGAAKKAS